MDRTIDMNVYIVTKDNEPFCVTLREQEAFGVFDRSVRMGGYRHASVDVVVASTNSRRVLQEAFGAQAA